MRRKKNVDLVSQGEVSDNASENKNCTETPDQSPPMVWFHNNDYHLLDPPSLELNWDPFNLTMRSDAKVKASVSTISKIFDINPINEKKLNQLIMYRFRLNKISNKVVLK